jgi:hypothetical protein
VDDLVREGWVAETLAVVEAATWRLAATDPEESGARRVWEQVLAPSWGDLAGSEEA